MQRGEGVFEIIPVPSAILVISKTTSKKGVIELRKHVETSFKGFRALRRR